MDMVHLKMWVIRVLVLFMITLSLVNIEVGCSRLGGQHGHGGDQPHHDHDHGHDQTGGHTHVHDHGNSEENGHDSDHGDHHGHGGGREDEHDHHLSESHGTEGGQGSDHSQGHGHNHGHGHGHDGDDHGQDGGGHGHDHGHGHHHGNERGQNCKRNLLGCSSREAELDDTLDELISQFGLKVLGKDQESADDTLPTQDAAHLNFNSQVLIDELFHPTLSPKPRIFTTSPRTSTESLPIKEHDIGLVDSPTDLIMSNHIAEPVFEDLRRKSRKFGSTTPAPVYLTETQYYLDKDQRRGHFSPLESDGRVFDGHIVSDHLTKPVLHGVDVRPFHFALINDKSVQEVLENLKRRRPKLVEPQHHHHHREEEIPFVKDLFGLNENPTADNALGQKTESEESNDDINHPMRFRTSTSPPFILDLFELVHEDDNTVSKSGGPARVPSQVWRPPTNKHTQHDINSHNNQQRSQKTVPGHATDILPTKKIHRQESWDKSKNKGNMGDDGTTRREESGGGQIGKQIRRGKSKKMNDAGRGNHEEIIIKIVETHGNPREINQVRNNDRGQKQPSAHGGQQDEKNHARLTLATTQLRKKLQNDRLENEPRTLSKQRGENEQDRTRNMKKSVRFTLAPPELPSSTQLTKDIRFSLTPPSVQRPTQSRTQSGKQKLTTLRTKQKQTTPRARQKHITPRTRQKQTTSRTRQKQITPITRQKQKTTLITKLKLPTTRPKQKQTTQRVRHTTSTMLKSTLAHVRDDIQHEARKKTNGHSMSGHRNNRNRPLVITGNGPENNRQLGTPEEGKQNIEQMGARQRETQDKSNGGISKERKPKAFNEGSLINHSTKFSAKFKCPADLIGLVLFADISTECQRFFMCQPNGRMGTFTCPIGTLFSQEHQVCDWAKKVDCSNSENLF